MFALMSPRAPPPLESPTGGHTAEMLGLMAALPASKYGPLSFVRADTDRTTEPRARAAKVRRETSRRIWQQRS